jgi:hypothetical protein
LSAKPHPPRYFCPIPGCTVNLSQARSIKKHYERDHTDVTDKEKWNAKLAVSMPHDEWLVKKRRPSFIEADRKRREERAITLEEEKELDATSQGRVETKEKGPERGKQAMAKEGSKNEKSLREPRVHKTSPEDQPRRTARARSMTGPASASAGEGEGEGEVPSQSQAPATLTINGDESSGPRPRKCRKLDVLLDTHKDQIQAFIQQGLQEAQDNADNAEALLQTLMTQREGVVPNDVQEEMERLKKELDESKEQVQRMEERIENLENEIQDEKAFGLSTEMKEKYLAQAKGEAKIAAKLNLSWPEYGGFVY